MRSMTGADIRQSFIDFFVEHGHTAVPSSSLVPGGDATLLFTNSGMVQFKDVFLGQDKRPYKRAVDSQKCLRVAGKHNDLDEVGRDDTHHTFFEMLGNWSFGDYYKKEAIEWAYELLTTTWGLERTKIWATCFEGEKSIPADEEAAEHWRAQPGFISDHVLYFGRKDNFWEMAETGPCGPCSEIHYDRGPKYCTMQGVPGHVCKVNGDCGRFLELWNLVFMQYNRLDADTLEALPARHVDTGMGFERIVSVLQDVDSNYKSDLFVKSLEVVRELAGTSHQEMLKDFTPYRVIADHARSAAFLIADGVVPGNVGRNYVCRMIIRRAARFGTKIGLTQPFLAGVAEAVIATYGGFYPELIKNAAAITDNLTREEIRFARTIEAGTAQLQHMLTGLGGKQGAILNGQKAFDLYATYGLPFEIARDIAREQSFDVDHSGFETAMERHRLASGGGKAMGHMGGEDAEFYSRILSTLQTQGKLGDSGVVYDPYTSSATEGEVLALIVEGEARPSAAYGDAVEVILPRTGFYIESGGQVSDHGLIRSIAIGDDGKALWEIEISGMRRPAAGVIVHTGEVVAGQPRVGDQVAAVVDATRRHDIMRNHTATHLLHAALHQVLGEHARQAGSLVAPDHLRFDFNHPEALTKLQLERIEQIVNDAIAADLTVMPKQKSREAAVAEGAMALFGEKYGETVRTISILQPSSAEASPVETRYSYELCGGTHLDRTSDVGVFLIVSEGSAAAGVRRIEAVTGRGAYALVKRRLRTLNDSASVLKSEPGELTARVEDLQRENSGLRRQVADLRLQRALALLTQRLEDIETVGGVRVISVTVPDADVETLRVLADKYRERFPEHAAGVFISGRLLLATVTDDMAKNGLKAADLIAALGGRGGGRPVMAQGSLPGDPDAKQIIPSIARVVREHAG
jgi:alanyl-tRNA synthetase